METKREWYKFLYIKESLKKPDIFNCKRKKKEDGKVDTIIRSLKSKVIKMKIEVFKANK